MKKLHLLFKHNHSCSLTVLVNTKEKLIKEIPITPQVQVTIFKYPITTTQNKGGQRMSATQMMIENTLKTNNNLLSLLNRLNTTKNNGFNNRFSNADNSKLDSSNTNLSPSSKKV